MRIAFLSYKSGVGRTKLALNCAAYLSSKGYRIGLVDFDLEASSLALMLEPQRDDFKGELLTLLSNPWLDYAKLENAITDVTHIVKNRFSEKFKEGGKLKYIPTTSDLNGSRDINYENLVLRHIPDILRHFEENCGVDGIFINFKPGFSPSAEIILAEPMLNLLVLVCGVDSQSIVNLDRNIFDIREHIANGKIENAILVVNMIPDHPESRIRVEKLKKICNPDFEVFEVPYDSESLFDDDFKLTAKENSAFAKAIYKIAARITDDDDYLSAHSQSVSRKDFKIHFYQRLGNDWSDLADFLEIPLSNQNLFIQGYEARFIWDWLETRNMLGLLPLALRGINRPDLARELSVLATSLSSPSPSSGNTESGVTGRNDDRDHRVEIVQKSIPGPEPIERILLLNSEIVAVSYVNPTLPECIFAWPLIKGCSLAAILSFLFKNFLTSYKSRDEDLKFEFWAGDNYHEFFLDGFDLDEVLTQIRLKEIDFSSHLDLLQIFTQEISFELTFDNEMDEPDRAAIVMTKVHVNDLGKVFSKFHQNKIIRGNKNFMTEIFSLDDSLTDRLKLIFQPVPIFL